LEFRLSISTSVKIYGPEIAEDDWQLRAAAHFNGAFTCLKCCPVSNFCLSVAILTYEGRSICI
jgi:hypothetical protein